MPAKPLGGGGADDKSDAAVARRDPVVEADRQEGSSGQDGAAADADDRDDEEADEEDDDDDGEGRRRLPEVDAVALPRPTAKPKRAGKGGSKKRKAPADNGSKTIQGLMAMRRHGRPMARKDGEPSPRKSKHQKSPAAAATTSADAEADRASGQGGPADESIITEIKDRSSLQLLRVAGVSNFVISDELTSMITTHLARNPDLRHFWIENVFSDGKFEIDIVPVDRCVDCTSEIEWVDRTRHVLRSAPVAAVASMTYWDLLAACRLKGCTPIAVKRYGTNETHKWIFNPREKDMPLGLCAEDLVVVLAAKEGH